MCPQKLNNETSLGNGELKKFYSDLKRDDYELELLIKKDDIKRKSTGFYIFKSIRELFPNREIDTVIDVGGNYGIFLNMLSEEFELMRKICMDISEPSLKIDGVEYMTGFAEETLERLNANSVDLCLLQDVIEHIFDPDQLILQLKRVLKSGGVIILSTPNLSSLVNRCSLLFGFEPTSMEVSTKHIFGRPGSSVVGHIRNFTYGALRAFFLFYDFEIVSMFTYPAYFSGDGGNLARMIHTADKLSKVFGKKYCNQIFMVAKKH